MIPRYLNVLRRVRFGWRLWKILILFISAVVIFNIYTRSSNSSYGDINDGGAHGRSAEKQACIFPKFEPLNEYNRKFYWPVRNYNCIGEPSIIKVLEGNFIKVDDNVRKTYYENRELEKCYYTAITLNKNTRYPDENVLFLSRPNSSFTYTPIRIEDEFIKVVCTDKDRYQFHEEYLSFLIVKPEVENRCSKQSEKFPHQKLNVLVFGIDSISRLNFHRHFIKTSELLKKYGAIELKTYNKVGDSTLENMIPLLTGKYLTDYFTESVTQSFDHVDFIWKEFSHRGYRSIFLEEAPNMGAFSYDKPGFQNPPTDYYYRPYTVAIEKSKVRARSKLYCIDSELEFTTFLNIGKRFLHRFHNCSYFAFIFLSRLTHTYLNDAGYADVPSFDFLKDVFERNKNTVIIFMSDHGIRYGDIRYTFVGKVEERSPFMFAIFPEWFRNKYPAVMNNLIVNQDRLTTQFDIYKTLRDILNFPASLNSADPNRRSEPGISLFTEIPLSRTCADAKVLDHFCACHEYENVNRSSPHIKMAAIAVVERINMITSESRDKCAEFKLDYIISALSLNSLKSFGKGLLYQLMLTVSPSGAEFEATVEKVDKHKFLIQGSISRINRYGNQSYCIHGPVLKRFCYCVN
ncbi:Uncharacterised protein g2060 [Pycnogonum litorale]